MKRRIASLFFALFVILITFTACSNTGANYISGLKSSIYYRQETSDGSISYSILVDNIDNTLKDLKSRRNSFKYDYKIITIDDKNKKAIGELVLTEKIGSGQQIVTVPFVVEDNRDFNRTYGIGNIHDYRVTFYIQYEDENNSIYATRNDIKIVDTKGSLFDDIFGVYIMTKEKILSNYFDDVEPVIDNNTATMIGTIAFDKWLKEDTEASLLYNNYNCVWTFDITPSRDGSMSVYLSLYDEEAYDALKYSGQSTEYARLCSGLVDLSAEEIDNIIK